MVQFAQQNPEAVMLYHRFQNVDKDDKVMGPPQPVALTRGDYRRKYLRSGGSWWSPITSVLVFRPDHIRTALPMPTYAHREGADTVLTDYCIMTGVIASNPTSLTLRRLHGANLYAAGRDNYTYRSKEIRESDVRRIEWRMFSLKKIFERLGEKFEIDIDRNEWRVTNLYWLGRVSFWWMFWVSITCPEHSLKERWHRFKWVLANKRVYRHE